MEQREDQNQDFTSNFMQLQKPKDQKLVMDDHIDTTGAEPCFETMPSLNESENAQCKKESKVNSIVGCSQKRMSKNNET